MAAYLGIYLHPRASPHRHTTTFLGPFVPNPYTLRYIYPPHPASQHWNRLPLFTCSHFWPPDYPFLALDTSRHLLITGLLFMLRSVSDLPTSIHANLEGRCCYCHCCAQTVYSNLRLSNVSIQEPRGNSSLSRLLKCSVSLSVQPHDQHNDYLNLSTNPIN